MNHFQTISSFQKLLKRFNGIYRDIESIHDPVLPDNDAEHSYRVAMLCWMLVEEYKLPYDVNKILRYALLHDFPEVYAGDRSMYSNYSQTTKERAEHRAVERLKREFPKLKPLWKSIEQYEKRSDPEARFVYVVEKLEPVFIVILSEPNHFKKRGIDFDDFIKRKQRKIEHIDTDAQQFNTAIMKHLHRNRKKYFKL